MVKHNQSFANTIKFFTPFLSNSSDKSSTLEEPYPLPSLELHSSNLMLLDKITQVHRLGSLEIHNLKPQVGINLIFFPSSCCYLPPSH